MSKGVADSARLIEQATTTNPIADRRKAAASHCVTGQDRFYDFGRAATANRPKSSAHVYT